MSLDWKDSWDDIVEAAKLIHSLCETRLSTLSAYEQRVSGEVLATVKADLGGDLGGIRRSPLIWGTKLANVAVRIAKRLDKRDASERDVARQLANFSGIVFQFRRSRDQVKFEGAFRDSIESYLAAIIPELIGTTIAADLIEQVQSWLAKSYDRLPKDLSFLVNDLIVRAYEARRRELDTNETRGLMLRFVEDNRDIIKLPVSEGCEHIRQRWQEIYREHIGAPPAQEESRITANVRADLRLAIQKNDPMEVRDVLAPLEARLADAVRDSLDAQFELREPRRPVVDRTGEPSAEFEAARRQIRRNNPIALRSFREVWQGQRQNPRAKEWYGYALAKIEGGWRQAKALFDEIRRAGHGDQITDWNLACCEISLNDRQAAFQILKERVASGTHIDPVIEPAIALGLELKEKQFLGQHLDWLPLEEAVLLGYLYAADSGVPIEQLEQMLPAVEAIASGDRRFVPPHPAEHLSEKDLNDLCFAFIERHMIRGGISWFRRRVSFQEHEYFYLNWRLLADLCVQIRLLDEAVRAYDRMLGFTSASRTARPEVKQRAIEDVLAACLEHGLTNAAESLLSKHGGKLLPPAEAQRWHRRIRPSPEADRGERAEEAREAVATRTEDARRAVPWDARSVLMQAAVRLPKVRRLSDLQGGFDLLEDNARCLQELWPAHARKFAEYVRTATDSLRDYVRAPSAEQKADAGMKFRNAVDVLRSLLRDLEDNQLREHADVLASALGRLAEDISFQTSASRNLEIDWRLNGYLPDRTFEAASPDLPRTAILLRIINRGTDPIDDVSVFLKSESRSIQVLEESQRVNAAIGPGSAAIVRFSLSYESLQGEEAFLSFVRFRTSGVSELQSPATRFSLHAKSFSGQLGGRDALLDRFFVQGGIPDDRREIFHGREREQRRIANSLRHGVASEILFLNGPRRVGKTSILNSLKWALPELGLENIITLPLSMEDIPPPRSTASFLRWLARSIGTAVDSYLGVESFLAVPGTDEFESGPTLAFRDFIEGLKQRLTPRRVLIMIDETQFLAQAVQDGEIDQSVLGLFGDLASKDSGLFFIFTGSFLFREIERICPHPIWGKVTQYMTGFLNRDAVTRVLDAGVQPFAVNFTPEALDRVWEMTEGHPWVVQAIGKRIVSEVLNPQQRTAVGPQDVDQAVEYLEEKEPKYCTLWWHEDTDVGGFVDETDWKVARLIIERQEEPGVGIKKSDLFQYMRQGRVPFTHERLRKLVEMQTLAEESRSGADYVKIKGLFLERWLTDQTVMRSDLRASTVADNTNVALFVDHENVAVSMQRFIGQLPATKQADWEPLRSTDLLAKRLALHAQRHGTLVDRVVVANWPLFVQDLPAYAQAMFRFDQPLGGKNTSDERLKQLIRDTLEQKAEVGAYVVATGDADFRDTIQTLLKRNKRVVLWGFRPAGTVASNVSRIYHELEEWQNLTIEWLDDILLTDPGTSTTDG